MTTSPSAAGDREFHPVSEIFPLMQEAELALLANDIKIHGLRDDIWLHDDGRIIDGRNRALACERAGVAPKYRKWDGTGSLADLVVGLNAHRRHLDESQRAMAAALLANMPQGARNDLAQIGGRLSQSEAAALLNVGQRTVQKAAKICESDDRDLIDMARSGLVSVDAASAVAGLPNTERNAAVVAGPKGVKSAASKIRAAARSDRLADSSGPTVVARDTISAGDQPSESTAALWSASVEPTARGAIAVIVAEPHWRIPGLNLSGEQALGTVHAVSAATVKDRISRSINDMKDDNRALLLRVCPYLHEDARKVLEQLGFDHLFDIPVVPRLATSSNVEHERDHDYVLVGVQGDTAGLEVAALIHWLDERRQAPNQVALGVSDLACHLSRSPVLEVSWSDTDTGGGCD